MNISISQVTILQGIIFMMSSSMLSGIHLLCRYLFLFGGFIFSFFFFLKKSKYIPFLLVHLTSVTAVVKLQFTSLLLAQTCWQIQLSFILPQQIFFIVCTEGNKKQNKKNMHSIQVLHNNILFSWHRNSSYSAVFIG